MIRVVVLSVLIVLPVACGDAGDATPTPVATSSASPPAVATSEANAGATDSHVEPSDSPAPTGLEEGLVANVVDGDTIDVLIDGQEFRVRYTGIDTPETVDPRRPVECFGREADGRNRELVEGKTVGLERDVSETDRFGRLLRYVWVNGEMVNARLVEEGYATASAFPPDVRHSELFAALESQARADERGLWGPACATPGPPPAADGQCDYSGTGEPVIKGNISYSTGEKIYHVPGGDYYDETVIDEAKGERWFCTEAKAMEAGWRKSKR
jgi:micrococcal nuclease